MNNLENEIRKLIQLKKEGGYWDFKMDNLTYQPF